MNLNENIDFSRLGSGVKKILAMPWLFIVSGIAVLVLSAFLLFGGAGETRTSEKAMVQAQKLVQDLSRRVRELQSLVADENTNTLAARAAADPSPELLRELENRLAASYEGITEARVYDPGVLLLDFQHLGESRFIILDMFITAASGTPPPVQMLTEGGERKLAAAVALGDAAEPEGFLLVLADPGPLLDTFDLTLPAANYIGLEHAAGGFAPVTLREFGSGAKPGFSLVRIPVPGSMLRVVVPQSSHVQITSGFQQLMMFVLGGLLLAYGLIRYRISAREDDEFEMEAEALVPTRGGDRGEDDAPADEDAGKGGEGDADGAPAPEAGESEPPVEPIPLEDLHHELEMRHAHAQKRQATVELSADIFRAYDIRGIVGKSLDAGIAYKVGQAIGSMALDHEAAPVVVGRDGRHSGPELVDGLVDGMNSTGCDVIDLGAVPTGALYFAAHELGSGSGVMVTGSHNPPDYNGFKIVIGGRTLSGETIRSLHERIVEGDLRIGRGRVEGREILDDYRERIAGDIRLDRPLKVVADCGNGIGGVCAADVLKAIGAEVVPLFDDVDGDFPNHHPDPGDPGNLEDLIETVRLMEADLGVAFDGDADRLGVVTPEGQIVYPDRVMMLFAREILSRNPGATIIYDVKCTGHLDRVIEEAGGKPVMYKTGHSLIKRRMKELDAPFAGEMSGHFFFQDRWYGFDCGIYSAARLLEILARDQRPPGEVFESLPDSISTPELKVELEEGENHAFIERFQEEASFADARVSTIDGVRADFDDGWGLVRASNTTPVLVLRFEADSEEALGRVQREFADQLRSIKPDIQLPF